jgi:hypothetical protein
MQVSFNNPYNQYKNKTSFKSDEGVIYACKKIMTDRGNTGYVGELQVHLQDLMFTPEFIEAVKKLPNDFKTAIVDLAPERYKKTFQNIFEKK